VCNLNLLRVSWPVVIAVPTGLASLAEAIGTPQFGHVGAKSDTSLLHSGQLIKDMLFPQDPN
jgi:hypothetical protein